MSEGLTSSAWRRIFDENPRLLEEISLNHTTRITAKQINKYREARLMAKFDHRTNLPKVFTENNISILPVSRSEYVLGTFDAYKDFEETDEEALLHAFRDDLQTINPQDINSETTAVNVAFIANILQDFIGEPDLEATVNGRMGSGIFTFTIDNISDPSQPITIEVRNSQIEIDAGYESSSSFLIIEAKLDLFKDFIIRQLYYPYRAWAGKTELTKRVRTIFLTYSNGEFLLSEYSFPEPENYSSATLVNQQRYRIVPDDITLAEIQETIDAAQVAPEPDVPYPQADNFDRVINLCELVKADPYKTKKSLTEEYNFVKRQGDYYFNAARYLGLVRLNTDKFIELTPLGEEVFSMSLRQRQLALVGLIFQHQPFVDVYNLWIETGEPPSLAVISDVIERYRPDASGSTPRRRATTTRNWLRWVLDLSSDY